MGVQHDGLVSPFHGDGGIEGLPFSVPFSFNQVDRIPREQKFLKSAGVRKKGGDLATSQSASNEEAIGPVQKFRLEDMMKKTHQLSSSIKRHGAWRIGHSVNNILHEKSL
jgi:hypothetical protein